ncbi:MAG: 50S ribosomal protein L11 methyltransferase [Bacteroidales bacterium]|nr:50S ribosomal protein L11 methyltransferase [Bacteroidales bacterium]
MDYISLRINIADTTHDINDLLAAFLCEEGYESFVPDEEGLTAYIRADLYDSVVVDTILKEFPMEIKATTESTFVKGENWNEQWEKNYFKPLLIGGKVAVHSSFHTDVPKADYDILIDPKMAFGTGHHSTTSLMMQAILETDLEGKTVIDMGTGTGILAILCKMRGAGSVIGIEIDPGAFENAVENGALNNTEVNFILGDASKLEGLPDADFFMANINRNIITADIASYSAHLKSGGEMILSGFYEEDIDIITREAEKYSLKPVKTATDNRWAMVRLQKSE